MEIKNNSREAIVFIYTRYNMEKIKFTAPNGVQVEGTVLSKVGYEVGTDCVCVYTVYAQNRIAVVNKVQTLDGDIITKSVKIVAEYASIPELD